MSTKNLIVAGAVLAALAACGGGDVNLGVSTVDNSTGNDGGSGGTSNPCASYTVNGAIQQGSFDGFDCTYLPEFVSKTNPLMVDVRIRALPDGGLHIFESSLFVGNSVDTDVPKAGADNAGPVLTIDAGSTLVFSNPDDYVLINRGSKIIANGRQDAPITFTSDTDAVSGEVRPEDVQQWGGIVINGHGLTNNCSDAERAANACHVVSEGQPSFYGGNDNADSSGVLRYVVTKHSGYEVAEGNELNGVTFNAVGSGTVVENLQVYSTYDDGIEFFGGAVDVTNFVAMYVRDDSIDYSDGYVGNIRNALVIHSYDGGSRCVEADNINSSRAGEALDTPPVSNPIITNLTCIQSSSDVDGTHDASEGPLFRQGAQFQLADSIIFGGYLGNGAVGSNECFEIEHTESLAFAASGASTLNTTIIACSEATKGTLANGDTVEQWVLNTSTNAADYSFNTGNVIITDATNPNVAVLEPGTFYTATAFADAAGTAFTVGTGQQIGAVTRADDWTVGWTYGLHEGSRAQPLWFE